MKPFIGFAATAWMTAVGLGQNAATEQIRGRTGAMAIEGIGDPKMITEDRGEVVELTGQPARAFTIRSGFSTGLEHQSNAPLLGSGQRDDWLSISAFEAGINRPLGEKFSLDLSIRGDVAQYFHVENISYWGPLGTALLDYRQDTGWPRAYVGGQLYRYDQIDNGTKISDAGAVIAGFDQAWTFQGGRSAVTAGYQFSRYWASPFTEDRESHTMFATFTHQFTGSLYAQASYIWQYTGFENQTRHDSRHVAGLGLIYVPRDRFSVRLYANFVRNESSNPATDYENFTSGVGAAFSIQF